MLPGLCRVAGKTSKGGSYAAFPASYVTLIETFDEANRIHVNASTGDDSTGDGSLTAPYATIEKAMSVHATGDAIIIFPGTYTPTTADCMRYIGSTTTFTPTYADVVLHDFDGASSSRAVVYIGCPGQTIIQPALSRPAVQTYAFASLNNVGSAAYGLWIKRNNGGKSANYAVALFTAYAPSGTTPQAFKGDMHNCLFEELNANGYGSYLYGVADAALFDRCSFKVANMLAGYGASWSGTATIQNGQVEYAGTTPENLGTFTNMNKEVTFDSAGNASENNTTHGVYSGTYAWL